MPKVSTSVPHNHDPDEIVKHAQTHIAKMVDDFEGDDFQLDWSGRSAEFVFSVLGFKVSGNAVVDEQQISVDVDLPLAAAMFKNKIKDAITKNLASAVEVGGQGGG
jgi:hypothetical protein